MWQFPLQKIFMNKWWFCLFSASYPYSLEFTYSWKILDKKKLLEQPDKALVWFYFPFSWKIERKKTKSNSVFKYILSHSWKQTLVFDFVQEGLFFRWANKIEKSEMKDKKQELLFSLQWLSSKHTFSRVTSFVLGANCVFH